jgi:hypothetical protein
VTATTFLALAVTTGFAGLAMAWLIARQLGPTAPAAGLDTRRRLGPPATGSAVAVAYAEALVWARRLTTAELVDIARADPAPDGVCVWAAAHHVLAVERGVAALPARQAARR